MIGNFKGLFSKHWKTGAVGLALFALTFWLFWPATRCGFTNFDDDRYVSENPVVQAGLTAEGVRWACRAVYESYWLPVLWISYMLDTTLFGTAAFGYHLTNIVLHAVNAALLFLLLRAWTGRLWPSAFVAAFFAWHPLRVESVAWITERKDVLSGLFFLLALGLYSRYRRHPVPPRDLPVAIVMALGLMVKPILVILPFLMLVLDYWPFERWDMSWPDLRAKAKGLVGEKTLFWALAVLFSVTTYYTQHRSGSVIAPSAVPWLQRWGGVPVAYLFYLWKTLWPARLQVVYDDPPVTWFSVAGSVLALAAITAAAVRMARRHRAPLVGWLWFLGLLVPVIGIVRVGTVHVAERFTYLPSIGLGILIAWSLDAAVPGSRRKAGALSVAAVLLFAAYGWRVRAQIPVWQDGMTVFAHALKGAPDNHIANNNYATVLLVKGRLQEALEHFERAVARRPRFTLTTANVGRTLVLMGRTEEAIQRLEEGLRQYDTNCPNMNFVLGIAYVENGEPARGIPYLRRGLNYHPHRASWRMELVRALLEAGEEEAAREELQMLRMMGAASPGDVAALSGYYSVLWRKGEKARAWNYFRRAIEMDPQNAIFLNNAAWGLATDPDPPAPREEALRLARRAHEMSKGQSASILDTLAAAYAANGQFEEAVRYASEAKTMAERAGQKKLAEKLARRLEKYRQGEPWVEGG